ncbi:MAG: YggS family pyridoxal phosphate-dependent enzyme [Candidatus Omnitrophica bacterium]|nr:YggS family pyridoxal phosphate-dependent enzyme [Candidatus Omnitrophota bacterium]
MLQLDDVRERIASACRRAGRHPTAVTLIGVTKTLPVSVIQEAIRCGLADVGESRVQEAAAKRQELEARFRVEGSGLRVVAQNPEPRTQNAFPVRWHLVGHLQRNKAQRAVELFDVIHSVDSLALIGELERHAAEVAQGSRFKAEGKSVRRLEVFLQVKIVQEPTKFGCAPGDAVALARLLNSCTNLRLKGLMTIAPYSADSEDARPHFRRLRELRDDVASALSLEPPALSLSMGMSHDFEVAIEEGADFVRIGTAIFGERPGTAI